MIGILLNDNAYEQDIRELLMAFYPGESFAHERQAGARLYVEGIYAGAEGDEDRFRLRLLNEEAVWGECQFSLPYRDRLAAKTAIKRELYGLLTKLTNKTLPWGTLTGIRPTKIALTRLFAGQTREMIRSFMQETYLTSPEKTALSLAIAAREKELLSRIDYKNGYSLYVGIPFCPTTCLYCSFTSYPIGVWSGRIGLYLEAVYRELAYVASRMKGRPLHTVYLGGGTPTSLTASELDALLSKTEELFDLSTVCEYTVEAGRPDSITRDKLSVLKQHGISRISINPQTMKQETLELIGRRHTVDMTRETYKLAREMGFDNINMDLIIGLPGETLSDVHMTMEEIKRLSPDSLTVHSLAVKRAARLNRMWDTYAPLGMVNTQEMIGLAEECAREMGLLPYYLYRQKNMAGNFENVGYAAPGRECLYNVLMMEEKQTIAACGAGTTTKVLFPGDRIERAENVKDVAQYIDR
ncbi:MAG: coproporphyrinogen dehydrogenase HemZ, partial [Lachnospiraceae bacterium]|nr:coproporphyrinogen dehydrogenase HemZ [Lachnospiraceae bacterium]